MVAHEPWPKNRGNGSNGFPTWQWDITGIKHRARLISGGLWLKSRYIVLHNYMIYIYIYIDILCVLCFVFDLPRPLDLTSLSPLPCRFQAGKPRRL